MVKGVACGVLFLSLVASASSCKLKRSADSGKPVDLSSLAPLGSSGSTAAGRVKLDADMIPQKGGPIIGAVEMSAIVYERPDRHSNKIGYLRAGGTTTRGAKTVTHTDCEGGWYRVLPEGFMCASGEASIDPKHPILRALTRRPDLTKPMPYPYAFVRAIAPNYYRAPTKAEQFQFEMSLDRHLRSYKKMQKKWDEIKVGANDVPLDVQGNAIGEPPKDPPELSDADLFGGGSDGEGVPWFFQGGRQIPNIATFKAPDYAVITNRIARKAGLALIGSFVGENDRRFALTTDGRLVPTSKLKPGRGSIFHGVDLLKGDFQLPMGFVKKDGAQRWSFEKGRSQKGDKLSFHEPVQLTGNSKKMGSQRFVEAKDGAWIKDSELAIAAKPSDLPAFASKTPKWIDISIVSQTLVLYEGIKPVYVTAVATGKDGLGDPKTSFSTIRGTFKIREKHVTTTMDAHEVDNKFELRDVPWVEYFESGYALHAAPWHDDFGRPRSHGCVNVSPIDARRIFMWTDPPLPQDWHAVYSAPSTGEGTTVHIHP